MNKFTQRPSLWVSMMIQSVCVFSANAQPPNAAAVRVFDRRVQGDVRPLGFVGTIEFTVQISVTGPQSLFTSQRAKLSIGPQEEIRLDLYPEGKSQPMITVIDDKRAWLVSPESDVILTSETADLNSKTPSARLLSNQVRQSKYWANILFNAGLTRRIDPVAAEISLKETLSKQFLDQGREYQLEFRYEPGLVERVVDRWSAVHPDGTKDVAIFQNHVKIGSSNVALRMQFETLRPNGRSERSTYSITSVYPFDANDSSFLSLFSVPTDNHDFPELIGEVELDDAGAPRRTNFFYKSELRSSQAD